jgi:protocatechuate 3,4-dioxygenase beta subunit
MLVLAYARSDGQKSAPDHRSRHERIRLLDGHIGRRALLALGGLGLATLATARWRGQSIATAAKALSSTSRLPSADTLAAMCVLAPEQTQGPYYIPKEKVRSNIVERRAGTPLKLRLTVVDAVHCKPIKGAAVDIWHCNAGGIYSGFESASAGGAPGGAGGPTDKDTFLRGIQFTDAHGVVQFQTIYPGWYRGRTVHIHVMVHVGSAVVHTGQLYFADSLTDKVYQTGAYKARAAGRDTRNNTDSIYAAGGAQSTLAMKRGTTGGYTGAITLGVRTA